MNTKRHYIITTLGSYGDILPFIPLAESIKALGHEVTFVSNPYFRNFVADRGIDFYALGAEDDFLKATSINFRTKEGFVSFLSELSFSHLETLNQFILRSKNNNQKVIVICNIGTIFIVKAIKELNEDIQFINTHLSPWTFSSLYDDDHLIAHSSYKKLTFEVRENLWNFYSKKIGDVLPGLNEVRSKFNLAPITNLHQYLTEENQIHLTLFPKWFAKKKVDWPSNIIYGDFILSQSRIGMKIDQQLNGFIVRGSPPILIIQPTLQEKYVRTQETYLYKLIDNLPKKNKYRFIFSSPDLKDTISDNPAIFHTGYLNYAETFPKMMLIIHHGGIGTIAPALKFGLPQLIYKGAIDQLNNANLVEKLGAGILMKEAQPTEHEFLTYLEKLVVENTVKNKCESIKEKFMAALSPLQIADMIIESV